MRPVKPAWRIPIAAQPPACPAPTMMCISLMARSNTGRQEAGNGGTCPPFAVLRSSLSESVKGAFMAENWVRVAATADVAEGQVMGVRVGERDIALYHLPGGEFRATDNVCTHEYAQLSEGWLEGHSSSARCTPASSTCAPARRCARRRKRTSRPSRYASTATTWRSSCRADPAGGHVPTDAPIDCDLHPAVPGIAGADAVSRRDVARDGGAPRHR